MRTHDARFGQMLQTMSVCVRAQGGRRSLSRSSAGRSCTTWRSASTGCSCVDAPVAAPGAFRVHADEVARVSHAVRKRIRRLRTELRRAPLSLSLGRVDVLVPWKKRRIVCV